MIVPRTSRAYQRPVRKPHIFKLNGVWRVRYSNQFDPTWIHQAKFGAFRKACGFAAEHKPKGFTLP